ncbi:type II secretion system protein [Paraburkholderia sabiae]|jgi:general secretion pathway protein G|uniref:Type II secretion system protein n=2 Tax=Paraburkholderia sabiae TaxID=273251 RepID=A0ABU9QES0_9BURK|nr:type II secretion system protein [Paraburkholderia sabiae]WJZ76842.1 type II secretion system protein [Paraburkholderia sabiae]
MVMVTTTGRRRASGFTLIELLIVLSIIALMMTIALPNYFHSIDASKEKILAQNLHATRDAIDRFYGDVGRYPESLEELVDKRYLRTLPIDPITDSATTWHIVPPDEPFPGKVYDIKSGAQGADSNGKPYEAL